MIKALLKTLFTTAQHFFWAFRRRPVISVQETNYFSKVNNKAITLRYPKEKLQVPEVGRYRLELFLEDCIGCDKCARICPVDCITIRKVRTTDDLGKTRSGAPIRFYFPEFSIDLAQCCYCGLCTVVCPTDCLIMTPIYDKVVQDRNQMLVRWANISDEEAKQKEEAWNLQRKQKKKK